MLIDTHCHLTMTATYKNDFNTERIRQEITKIYHEALQHNVTKIIDVGTNVSESMQAVQLALRYPHIYAAIGIHPCDVSDNFANDLDALYKLFRSTTPGRIVAIGECGIDLYHTSNNLTQQQDAFYAQIELALSCNVPLIIHSRDAAEETLACLDRYRNDSLRGVMHCFSYDASIAHEITMRGLVLGIGGTITYPKNNELRSLLKSIALKHIILETDAPFLPPQPWRGQKNHPQYIRYLAEFIANLRNESFEHVALATSMNAHHVFGLS